MRTLISKTLKHLKNSRGGGINKDTGLDLLLLTVFGLIIWLINFKINFCGLIFPDAQYYASIARNIISGNGYLANLTSPCNFSYLGKNIFVPHINPPLFPYLLAILFKLGGVSDQMSACGSGLFFIISIIPLYLLANKLFDRPVAIIVSLVYIFEPTLLYLSISGLTEPLFIFFLLLAFLFLAMFFDLQKTSYIFWAGIFIGLAKLVRFNASVFIIMIVLALFLCVKQNRWKAAAVFLAGIIIIYIPEYIRVLSVQTPAVSQGLLNYAAADGTAQYPLIMIARLLNPPSSWEYIHACPKDFIYKYSENLFYYYKNFFVMINPLITAFFTVSVAATQEHRTRRILLSIVLFSILVQAGLISYSVPVIRYFYIFIPFMIIFGVGFFFAKILPDVNARFQKIFTIAMIFLFLLPTANIYESILRSYGILFRNYESKERVMIEGQKAIGNYIRANTKKDDFIATDDQSIAWYADRKTLYLPLTFNTLKIINQKYKKVDAILLTSKSDIKNKNELAGVGGELVKWRKTFNSPPRKLENYILMNHGKIGNEKIVFYKKR